MTTMNRVLPYMNSYGTIDISKAGNVEEALYLANMDWEVEQHPLYNESGTMYPGFVANVRNTDKSLLGIVSNSYRVIQNTEAFEFINDLVDHGFKFDRCGEFRGGKSIWVMGQLPEASILGDKVANNVVIVNSHDGSYGVKVMMTPVRLICQNMINLALKKAARVWHAKHTRHIYNRIEEAKYTLNLANNYMSALNTEANRLSAINVTDADIEHIFDSMFPIDKNKDTARKINNTQTLKNNLFNCYGESDISQFKGTAWGVINAVTDLIDHSAPSRNTATAYDNNWNKLINGHPVVDEFYKRLVA